MVLVEVQDAVVGCGLLLERDLDLVGCFGGTRLLSASAMLAGLLSRRARRTGYYGMQYAVRTSTAATRRWYTGEHPCDRCTESIARSPLTPWWASAIVSTLEHAITEEPVPRLPVLRTARHGQAHMARILAKALLCRNAEAARAEGASGCMPDGTCEECELIAEGGHPVSTSSMPPPRTGVDNVREEIINSVNFAPVRGKYKMHIIDEVHMLTTAAFNALLSRRSRSRRHT